MNNPTAQSRFFGSIRFRLCFTASCCIFGMTFVLSAVLIWTGIVNGIIPTENIISPKLVPFLAVTLLLLGLLVPCAGILIFLILPRILRPSETVRLETYHQFGLEHEDEDQPRVLDEIIEDNQNPEPYENQENLKTEKEEIDKKNDN